jgi:protein TonB
VLLSLPVPPPPAVTPAAGDDAAALRLAGGARSDLSPAQRRGLTLGIVALHAAGVWGLLQVNAVRDAVREAAPIIVSLLAPDTPPPLVAPPAPQPPKPQLQAKPAPRTPPLIAAPAVPAPSAEAFAVPDLPPPPPQATPAPLIAGPAETAPREAPARMLPDSAVQYLQPPELVYPRLSQRNGETGLVVVRAYVGSGGGAPYRVQVERSSGHARLDQAALAAVQKARFKPYAEKGQPVEGWALIPIRFELER